MPATPSPQPLSSDPTGSGSLFSPVTLRGGIRLANRVVMAPMTRSRASEPGDVPSDLAPTYYRQRAEAGLIVTEGTVISRQGKGYSRTPGIYSDEQQAAWASVADAVHEVPDARMFLQLWHVGRISHSLIAGEQPVSASAIGSPTARLWYQDPVTGEPSSLPAEVPRAVSASDIQRIFADYRRAARRAVDAGMDGVEIHGANGYLPDQFLRSTTNKRTDAYGGPAAARVRFVAELVAAVADEVGPERVGIRLSPDVDYGDTNDPEIWETTLLAAEVIDRCGIAYLHLVESNNANYLAQGESQDGVDDAFRKELRSRFGGSIILASDYDQCRAEQVLASGLADAVAFGRMFIANPDLVARFRDGAPVLESSRDTWYGGDAAGYTDYTPHTEESVGA